VWKNTLKSLKRICETRRRDKKVDDLCEPYRKAKQEETFALWLSEALKFCHWSGRIPAS
jgi:hypothetical protein